MPSFRVVFAALCLAGASASWRVRSMGRRGIVDVHLIVFRPDNYVITDVILDNVR